MVNIYMVKSFQLYSLFQNRDLYCRTKVLMFNTGPQLFLEQLLGASTVPKKSQLVPSVGK